LGGETRQDGREWECIIKRTNADRHPRGSKGIVSDEAVESMEPNKDKSLSFKVDRMDHLLREDDKQAVAIWISKAAGYELRTIVAPFLLLKRNRPKGR
jgi:hypothetical protein